MFLEPVVLHSKIGIRLNKLDNDENKDTDVFPKGEHKHDRVTSLLYKLNTHL